MFDIVLYKFPKKVNSMAYPVSDTTAPKKTFSCLMLTPCSISTPVIQIEDTVGISEYNYAYIPSFNRYYFITKTICNMPVWVFYLRVDVLASFRTSILKSRQYVARSTSHYNANIIDSLYPTVAKTSTAFSSYGIENLTELVYRRDEGLGAWTQVSYFDIPAKNGCVVVGVLTGTNTGVTYYGFSMTVFNDFLNKAFNLIPSTATSGDDLLNQALFDSLQYITTARWFPTLPLVNNTGGTTSQIKLGGQTINLTSGYVAYIMNELNVEKFKFQIAVPQHPNAGTYQYMKLAPYSKYNLFFQPFGDIALDSLKLYGSANLDVYWTTDYTTGATSIRIYSNTNNLVYNDNTYLGVPIPIAKLVYDTTVGLGIASLQYLRDAVDYMIPSKQGQAVGHALRNFILDNGPLGGTDLFNRDAVPVGSTNIDNVSLIGKMMDGISASLGQISVKGGSDSFLAYNMGKPYVYAWFMDTVEQNATKFGRPLKQEKKLEDLSGFCLCENANIDVYLGTTMPNEEEANEILRLLNSGVYIESDPFQPVTP